MGAALVWVYAAAAVLSALYAVLSWRRRRLSPLAAPLALITAGATHWSLAQAVAAGASPRVALLATYAMFPGVAMIVAGFVWHTTVFTGHRLDRLRRRQALLLVHPVLLMLFVLTDPWHHAFFDAVRAAPGGGVTAEPGPLYWLHTVYCYAMIGLGTARGVVAMRRAVRGHRLVFVIFLTGAFAPAVGNLVSIFVDMGERQVDLTPVLFVGTATMWWWAERSGLSARRMPVAYKQVIAALSDAVMVLDRAGRFLDVNPAAAAMLAALHPASAGHVVGRPWQEIAGPQLAPILSGPDQQAITVAGGTVYDVRVVPLRPDRGESSGTVVVVRDITELERLRAELTDQAVRDGLTGVYNRRHLNTVLREQVRRAAAEDRPLSAVLIDVDHFKAVNDTYGHATGDEVLIRLAQGIDGAVGTAGTVARYGGEEFAVVLPGIDARAAADLAERWRQACSLVVVDTPRGPLRATFSAGVVQTAPGASAEDLLRHADRALYAAKEQGRNRVVVGDLARAEGLQVAGR
ncbi:sensor domain-containing diguanylate cyclase [Actinoplanes teichomyceticus]|uniref:Diguanylate cyclase (GGDEF)-like protein n=1 Tax=Actinoplanes teichomyceticus TaxID=1867 RepID=A0A561VL10_ACTTI|nr:diguanylate cyclase [Actinoplanes teichomyceticus]TWG12306.1 diguanylate cyclase (GGDEF)-like protein [Actinoplanes teichomyceticus]GIF14247.1 GGDEF domain-containing protein [Actinoplanes teichomyceticus]